MNTTTPLPDLEAIIYRCQQGELAAFTELFRASEMRLYRLALAILCDEPEAENAVQEIFLRVFERIRAYRAEASFNTWLTAIAVNYCRDQLRRRKVRQALSLDWLRGASAGAAPDPADAAAEHLQKQTLWNWVGRLAEKYRLPVILFYYEGLTAEEAAAVLRLPVGAVYARLTAARKQLRAARRAAEQDCVLVWSKGSET